MKVIVFGLLLALSCADLFANAGKRKKLILLICDGLGPQQVNLLDAYYRSLEQPQQSQFLWMKKNASVFTVETDSYEAIVPDSASSATQIAIGEYARPEMIGLNYKGEDGTSILDLAHDADLATALLSDTRITHATPAAFAIDHPDRKQENAIARKLLDSKADILISGGLNRFLPQSIGDQKTPKYQYYRSKIPTAIPLQSARQDDADLLELAISKGYQLSFSLEDLQNIQSGKVLGLFGNDSMPSRTARQRLAKQKQDAGPTLVDLSRESLRILNKNPKGYFAMIESGQIDWAAHGNDTGYLLNQLKDTDELLKFLIEWIAQNPDTLLVVTSDHDTGGFVFSYSHRKKAKSFQVGPYTYEQDYRYGEVKDFAGKFKQEKTCVEQFKEFSSLDATRQNPETFRAYLEKANQSEIELSFATTLFNQVFSKEKSTKRDPHSEKYWPKKRFYFCNQLSNYLYQETQTIWTTSGHTASPIVSYALGYKSGVEPYRGLMHNIELGRLLRKSLGLDANEVKVDQ